MKNKINIRFKKMEIKWKLDLVAKWSVWCQSTKCTKTTEININYNILNNNKNDKTT